jgi:putative alpha-1,2-mannosidase
MFWFFVGVVFLLTAVVNGDDRIYQQVNSFVGSGGTFWGYGGISPAAQLPFGAFRIGPETTQTSNDYDWEHSSGYNYADSQIRAISHTHLVGAGCSDLAGFGIMPTSTLNHSYGSWWSSFTHDNEFASPGYYSVVLDNMNTKAEVVAISTMAGMHRYSSNSESFNGIVLDVCHGALRPKTPSNDRCLFASFNYNSDMPNRFTATMKTNGTLSGQLVTYLYGEISFSSSSQRNISSWTVCTDDNICEKDKTDSLTTSSKILYSIAEFSSSSAQTNEEFTVEIRVGISFVSEQFAQRNLYSALKEGYAFEDYLQETKKIWTETFSFVEFSPMNDDKNFSALFSSALYRSLLSPTNYTESDGSYYGIDGKVHMVKEERAKKYGFYEESSSTNNSSSPGSWKDNQFSYFSDYSFWDTYRTVHPWYLLINEDLSMAFARSITEITLQQNAFPRWVLASHESSVMNGIHGLALFIEMAFSGFADDLDLLSIQKVVRQQLTTEWPINGRIDLDHYLQFGYISAQAAQTAPSLSLSNYYDDYLLSVLSQLVNDSVTAEESLQRSRNFVKLWSEKDQFFCPRLAEDGLLLCPENPTQGGAMKYYVEGDGLHYSYDLLHDLPGLIALSSNNDSFHELLKVFMQEGFAYDRKQGTANINPYYWMGNEHDFHVPWLFNYLPNACQETQYWTRNISVQSFSLQSTGLPGNDDYGTTSIWFLFASLGLYPLAGSTRFFISSPRVETAKIRLTHWNKEREEKKNPTESWLQIITYNNSVENLYVERLFLNGEEITTPFLERSQLTSQETVKLEFFMHSLPKSGLCS